MSRVSRISHGWPLVALTLLAYACPAGAAEWAVDASSNLRSEFASNPRLLESTDGGAAGLVADMTARFGWRSEAGQLELSPRLVVREFTGDYALSGVDYGFAAAFGRSTERRTLKLTADYLRDDASTSGFDTTGYFETAVPRETFGAGAEVLTSLTERTQLLLRVGPQAVRFDAPDAAGLVDYDYLPLLAYVQRELSPRLRTRLLGRAALLEATTTGLESREVGAGVGVDYSLSERWTTSADVGPTWLAVDDGPYETGLSYRLALDGRWPRTEVNLVALQVSSPTAGRGVFETRDDFDLAVRHALRERWTVRGGLAYARYATDRGAAGATEDRTYSRVYGGLDWQTAERLLLQLQVTHERQEAAQDGEGTRVSLGLTWNGRLAAVSR